MSAAEPDWIFDEPMVCIEHGSHAPCRKSGVHDYTTNPYWVKAVRDYHASPIEGLTWEPSRKQKMWVRKGDQGWWEVGCPTCRAVIDIAVWETAMRVVQRHARRHA